MPQTETSVKRLNARIANAARLAKYPEPEQRRKLTEAAVKALATTYSRPEDAALSPAGQRNAARARQQLRMLELARRSATSRRINKLA